MSYKKRVSAFSKKAIISFIALTTLLMMTGGLSILPVSLVKAAVTTSEVTDDIGSMGRMAGPMMPQCAFRINLAGSASETLNSITVDIINATGGFDPTSHLYALSDCSGTSLGGVMLYKDHDSQGSAGYFDPPDNFSDTKVSLTATPTWTTISGGWQTTLTLSDVIPENDSNSTTTGDDYFLIINTSSAPPPDSTFKVQINGSNARLSDGTNFPTNDTLSGTITISSGGIMGKPIVISEVSIGKSGGGNTQEEFIELYNRTPDSMNLSSSGMDVRLHIVNGEGTDKHKPLTFSTTTIPGYGFFLIAATGSCYAASADATYVVSGNTLVPKGAVYISESATDNVMEIDKLGWGNATPTTSYEGDAATALTNNAGSLERKAFPNSMASDMYTGGMDANKGNGEDTDNNLYDFVSQATSTPQNSGSTIENPDAAGTGGGGSTVIINEVYYNTTANSGWIELYNTAATSASSTVLAGKKIVAAGDTYVFPAATPDLVATGYMVVIWNATGTDSTTTVYTSNSSSTVVDIDMLTIAGDIVFTDTNGTTILDYVQYGNSGQANENNGLNAVGNAQWVSGEYTMKAMYQESIGRGNNGFDSNHASDWQVFSSHTQGATNSGGDTFAPKKVTNVVLTDSDNSNYGVDGRDVTVTWTPDSLTDPSFDRYMIYLLQEATTLNTGTHTPFTELWAGQTQSSWTGGPGNWQDSSSTALTAASYKAYVVAVDTAGNKSSPVASSATTTVSDGGGSADTIPPMIMHMPVSQMTSSTDVYIIAKMGDDRATIGTGSTTLAYKIHTDSDYTTATATTALNSDFFKFIIPSVSVTTAGVDYYLYADDGTNVSYFYDGGQSGSSTVATSSPFFITVPDAVAGTSTISGTVYKMDGTVLSGATVYLEGSGLDATTTGASGTFAFSTVRSGSYCIQAFKTDYMEMGMCGVSVNPTNTSNTGNDLYLSAGKMMMIGSTGGGIMEMPRILWVDPGDGMMDAPVNISSGTTPIVAHMSCAMDVGTIDDTDPTDANSNVYLTINGNDRVSGTVSYSTTSQTITFSSNTQLSYGTAYTFVITSAVKDTNGNPIEANQYGGGQYAGSYVSTFNTYQNITVGQGDVTYGQGSAVAPTILSTTPLDGAFNVATNTLIIVTFSQRMEPSTISNSTVKLYNIGSGEYVSCTVSLDNRTGTIATLTPPLAGLSKTDRNYAIRVFGAVANTSRITMLNQGANNALTVAYQADFAVDADADTNAPQVEATSLQMYCLAADPFCDVSVAGNLTDVPTNLGSIDVSFDKDMNAATINAGTVALKAGTNSVNGSITYAAGERMLRFNLSTGLSPSTSYSFTVNGGTGGVEALNSQALASNYVIKFKTTNTVDSVKPNLTFANATEYQLAVTFSEPMNAAKITDTTNWSTSVLNPANYILIHKCGGDPALRACYSGGTFPTCQTLSSTSGLNISYDSNSFTVTVEGLFLDSTGAGTPTGGFGFGIVVNNAADLSGNVILGDGGQVKGQNMAGGPIGSSSTMGDMMGPMMGGGMMMGSMTGGAGPMDMGDFGEHGAGGEMMMMSGGMHDMGNMGMMPSMVMPMSMMAGMTTNYFIDMPTTKQIPASGYIVLTFPAGFNISSAEVVASTICPSNADINGPGDNAVAFATADSTTSLAIGYVSGGSNTDGLTVNTSARIISLLLGSVPTMSSGDFLHFELKGIRNSVVAKDFNTTGYSVDMKTTAADGTVLESMTSMPIFIQKAGTNTITGTTTLAVAPNATGTLNIYLGSPMTGPLDTTITFGTSSVATTSSFSFANLPNGEYMLFTEPSVTIDTNDYLGKSPDRIYVNGGTTKNIDFTLNSAASGTAIAPQIIGDFSAKSYEIDIFAHSHHNFTVKTVTLNGTYTSIAPWDASTTNNKLYLPQDGEWWVGIGPAMPKGPMMMGPFPEMDWMPPQDIKVVLKNGIITENSGMADDSIIVFDIGDSSAINGYVRDGSGNAIGNADIFAYNPMGGMGNHATTQSDGSFSLYLPDGNYKMGAFVPGMPGGQEISLRVSSGVAYIKGSPTVTTSIILKIEKPAQTISGKVTDGTNIIQGASVYAYCDGTVSSNACFNGPGHSEAMTDNSGEYILYVSQGTWKIGVFLPGYGSLPEVQKKVSTSDIEKLNFAPVGGDVTYNTISGTVCQNTASTTTSGDSVCSGVGTTITNGHVWIEGPGGRSGRDIREDGTYSFKIASSTGYTIRAWTPDKGDLPPIRNVDATSDLGNQDFLIGASRTITIKITTDGATPLPLATTLNDVMVDLFNITSHFGNNLYMGRDDTAMGGSNTAVSQADMTVPSDGDYEVHIHAPGMNISKTDISGATGTVVTIGDWAAVVTVDGDETIIVTLPTYHTVSGTVTNGGVAADGGWVEVSSPNTNIHFGCPVNTSDGTFSLDVVDDDTYPYVLTVMRPGYVGSSRTITVYNENLPNQNLTLTSGTLTISGYVYKDADSDGAYDSGEGLTPAFVHAEKAGGGFAGTPADPNGYYELTVDANSTWRLFGVAEQYQEATYSGNPVLVGSSSVSNVNIPLTTRINLISPSPQTIEDITKGGTFDDSDIGTKVTISAGAIKTTTNNGGGQTTGAQISVKETSNLPKTSSSKPVGTKGKDITASLGSQSVTDLSGQGATLDFTYTTSTLFASESATDSSINSKAEVEKLKVGYWSTDDETWKSLTTNPTYLDASGNSITPADNLSNVDSIVFKANTTHFSTFALLSPSDSSAPATPTGLAAVGSTSGAAIVTLTWTANIEGDLSGYFIYRSTDGGNTYPLLTTVTSGTTVTYSDSSGLSAGTTYYYKIAAYDTADNESAASAAVSAAPTVPSGGGGGAGGGGDTIAPSISNISVSEDSFEATISWTTNESSISWVVYGDSAAYGSEEKTTTYTKSHSVILTGLSPATTYYYKVKSKDSAGNVGTYTGKTFTTLTAEGEVVAPTEEVVEALPAAAEEVGVEKPISEMTIAELETKIAQILEQINILKAELAKMTGSVAITDVPAGFSFETNLKYQVVADDVRYLQIVLNSDSATRVAETGVGSSGSETNYFGNLTKAGVIKFQEKYASETLTPWGLTAGNGFVGSTTREKLNALLGQ